MRKQIRIRALTKPQRHQRLSAPITVRDLHTLKLEAPPAQKEEILEKINQILQIRLKHFPEDTAKLTRTEVLIDSVCGMLNNFHGNLVGGYRRRHLESHRKLYESKEPDWVKKMDIFHEKIDEVSKEIGFDLECWSKKFNEPQTTTDMQKKYLQVWPLFVELLKRGFTLKELVS